MNIINLNEKIKERSEDIDYQLKLATKTYVKSNDIVLIFEKELKEFKTNFNLLEEDKHYIVIGIDKKEFIEKMMYRIKENYRR